MMTRLRTPFLEVAASLFLSLVYAVVSTAVPLPYTPVPITGVGFGPGTIPPSEVWGKEYSHDRDHEITAVGTAPDPQQIVAWDGIGGVANGLDYSFTRQNFTPDSDIDAIANHGDALYTPLKGDRAHLIYSISRNATAKTFPPPPSIPVPFVVPSSGPISLVNGNVIGGAGEISFELGTVPGPLPNTHGLWASQPEINFDPHPDDIDGIEVWGPEPAYTADSNKYSLVSDITSGVSVWNGIGTPYISHGMIVSATTSLLGFPTHLPLEQLIDLDALMVRDWYGSPNVFERDRNGLGADEIIFSIRQILDPLDPSGYYATGSELMVLDATGGVSFLRHGGHIWDKDYALANMVAVLIDPAGGETLVQLDINAIEAIADRGDLVIPEPTCFWLCCAGLVAIAGCRFRR